MLFSSRERYKKTIQQEDSNSSPQSKRKSQTNVIVENVVDDIVVFIRLLYLAVYQNVSARCVYFEWREFDVFHFRNVQEIHF